MGVPGGLDVLGALKKRAANCQSEEHLVVVRDVGKLLEERQELGSELPWSRKGLLAELTTTGGKI